MQSEVSGPLVSSLLCIPVGGLSGCSGCALSATAVAPHQLTQPLWFIFLAFRRCLPNRIRPAWSDAPDPLFARPIGLVAVACAAAFLRGCAGCGLRAAGCGLRVACCGTPSPPEGS